jgi:hypothetical protein
LFLCDIPVLYLSFTKLGILSTSQEWTLASLTFERCSTIIAFRNINRTQDRPYACSITGTDQVAVAIATQISGRRLDAYGLGVIGNYISTTQTA